MNLTNKSIMHVKKDGIEYLQFKCLLEHSDKLTHCITTKIGEIGNPSVNHAEASEHTRENFKMLCDVMELDYHNLVFANQVHEDAVRIVSKEDRGEGILRPRKIEGSDALLTGGLNTALVAFFADCVPVLFYDPERNVIASTHAGWRGTVKKIASKTVQKMVEKFKCNPQNIIACVGPSIGKCCFEVNTPVKDEFERAFGLNNIIIEPVETGKFKINLWEANIQQLLEKKLKPENIHSSGICTACNNQILYSYRADGSNTGRNYSLMQLK
ncbi:MAG: peptidoglycan editing factor PgeF [Deltaproteobacteria bacterium]